MRNAMIFTVAVAAVAAMIAGGCANYTQPIVAEPAKTASEKNFDAVWQSSLAVLRDYYFTVDLQDRREGVIKTFPLTGKYATEFWRKDAASNFDKWESTIQTIYRTVTVTIKPSAANPQEYVASVEAQTTRSDRPVRQMGNAYQLAGMHHIQGDESEGELLLMRHEELDNPKAVLVPLGRDKALEAKISMDIVKEGYKRK